MDSPIELRRAFGSRYAALAVAAVSMLGLVLLALAGSAKAAIVYQHTGSFSAANANGALPTGIAVNATSGDVYVANIYDGAFAAPGQIKRFDSSGSSLGAFGTGNFTGVAVDPATGNVFGLDNVGFFGGDPLTAHIESFTAAGAAGPFAPVTAPTSGTRTTQIAVDPNGGAIYHPSDETNTLQRFNPATGASMGGFGPGTGGTALGAPSAVAADSNFNLAIVDGTTPSSNAAGRAQRFNPVGTFIEEIDSGDVVSVAIGTDGSVGGEEHTFVGKGTGSAFHIVVYDSAGDEIHDFGTGVFANSLASSFTGHIAVNSTTGRVYATDPRTATAGMVHMFDPVEIDPPTVATGAASSVTQTAATLNGTVNPNGDEVTDCHFEWGTTTAYDGGSAPCSPDPGDGSSGVAVSANATSLQPNTQYHFRVVATNGGGEVEGDDQTFTTQVSPPDVTTTAGATAIGETSASVAGTVDPNGGATSCEFEYGKTTAYGSTVACASSPGSGDAPVPATATLTGLEADTTYHFRLKATNPGGSSNGGDQTFKTAAPPAPPAPPSQNPPPGGGGGNDGPSAGTVGLPAKAVVKSGKAHVKVTCRGAAGSTCKGSVTLTAKLATGKKGKPKTVTIGKASFSLAAGKSVTLRIGLSRAAKKAVTAKGKLSAKASAPGARTRAVVLESPPKKKKSKKS